MAFVIAFVMVLGLMPSVRVYASAGDCDILAVKDDPATLAELYTLDSHPDDLIAAEDDDETNTTEATFGELLVVSNATTAQKKAKAITDALEQDDGYSDKTVKSIFILPVDTKVEASAAGYTASSRAKVSNTANVVSDDPSNPSHKIIVWFDEDYTFARYDIALDGDSIAEVTADDETDEIGKVLSFTTNHDTKTYTITGIPFGTQVKDLLGNSGAGSAAINKDCADWIITTAGGAALITDDTTFGTIKSSFSKGDNAAVVTGDVLVTISTDDNVILHYILTVNTPSNNAAVTLVAQTDDNFIPGLTVTSTEITGVPYYKSESTRTTVTNLLAALKRSNDKPATLWKVVTSTNAANITNAATFGAEDDGTAISGATAVETGNYLVVKAEDGTIKKYKITVLAQPPTELTVTPAKLTPPVNGTLELTISGQEGSGTKVFYRIVDAYPTMLKVDASITVKDWLGQYTMPVNIEVGKDKYIEAVEVNLSNKVQKWGVSALTNDGVNDNQSSLTAVTPESYGTVYISGLAVNETAKEITGIPFGKTGTALLSALVKPDGAGGKVMSSDVAAGIKASSNKSAAYGGVTSKSAAVEDGDILVIMAQDTKTFAYYTLKVLAGSSDTSITSKGTMTGLTVGTGVISGIVNNTTGTNLLKALNKPGTANWMVVTAVNAVPITNAASYQTAVDGGKAIEGSPVASGNILVVKAENGAIAKYTLSVLPAGVDVTEKAGTAISVSTYDIINVPNGIKVSELLNSLDKAADANWIVMAEDDAEMVTDVTTYNMAKSKAKAATATIVNRDALLVINGVDFQPYEILIRDVIKADLEALITEAEAEFGEEEDTYTVGAWSAFDTALKNAKAAVKNSSLDERELIGYYDALELAMDDLDIADALEKLIEDVESLDEEDYDPNTWEVLEEALAEAILISSNEMAGESFLRLAYTNLKAAKDALKMTVTAARAALEMVVLALSDGYETAKTQYTPESWAAFEAVYKAALAALEDEETEASVFEDILERLDLEFNALVSYEDLLVELIDSVSELDVDDYTDDSWQAVLDAIEYAEFILDNSGTVNMIKSATAALQKAIDGLELIKETEELNTEAIDAAIIKAEAALKDITIAEDAKEVAKGEAFWSQADVSKLSTAITDAKKAKTDAKEQKDIDDAVSALESAITAFEAAEKIGTYEEIIVTEEPKIVDISLTGGETWKQLGENVNITVNATGSGPLSYIWYYIDEAGVMVTLDDQTGATLTNTTKATGLYAYGVVVLNEAGQAWSDHVWVYVWQCTTPEITVQPTVGHPAVSWLEQGQGFNLSVTATGGVPTYYIWYYIHESDQGNLVVFGNDSDPALVATPNQSGVYAYGVVVINPAGVVWSDLVWVYVYNNVAPANVMFDSMMFDDVVVDDVVVDEVVVEDVVVDDVVVDTVMPE